MYKYSWFHKEILYERWIIYTLTLLWIYYSNLYTESVLGELQKVIISMMSQFEFNRETSKNWIWISKELVESRNLVEAILIHISDNFNLQSSMKHDCINLQNFLLQIKSKKKTNFIHGGSTKFRHASLQCMSKFSWATVYWFLFIWKNHTNGERKLTIYLTKYTIILLDFEINTDLQRRIRTGPKTCFY